MSWEASRSRRAATISGRCSIRSLVSASTWFDTTSVAAKTSRITSWSAAPQYLVSSRPPVSGTGPPTRTSDGWSTRQGHFRDEWGVTFQTLEALNEPVSGWWRFGGRQEGCHFDRASQISIIQRLEGSLESKGLDTRVSAPDENTIDLTVSSFVPW